MKGQPPDQPLSPKTIARNVFGPNRVREPRQTTRFPLSSRPPSSDSSRPSTSSTDVPTITVSHHDDGHGATFPAAPHANQPASHHFLHPVSQGNPEAIRAQHNAAIALAQAQGHNLQDAAQLPLGNLPPPGVWRQNAQAT